MSEAVPMSEPKNRREFLLRLGTGAGIVAVGYQGAASLRSLVPNVSYDAPTTVKLGAPADFPDGLKFLPDQRLFVFREGNTFHAISAVCTHLGCNVNHEPGKGFACPCHGSTFEVDGRVRTGPAAWPLPRFAMSLSRRGELIVDTRRTVGPDFRLKA